MRTPSSLSSYNRSGSSSARARERRQHRLAAHHVERVFTGAELGGAGLDRERQGAALRELVDREPREHAFRCLDRDFVALARELVALFQEQPLVAGPTLGAHQAEAAAQLVAVQHEVDLAAELAVLGRVLQVANTSDVPGDHRPSAVVTLGYDVLEVHVLERMLLRVDRQPALVGIEGRAPWHGKALQRASDLKSQIVVPLPCRMQVHHEAPRPGTVGADLPFSTERFVGPQRIALLPVPLELIVRPRAGDRVGSALFR